MKQNINNAEEQIQRPLPSMNRLSPILQPHSGIQLSMQTFRQHKNQYIALLFLLVQIILSVVVFVLLLALNYVGFGRVNESFRAEKIQFQGENCSDEYLVAVGKFVPFKIRVAFVFLCVEMFLAFANVVLGFVWTLKVIRNRNQTKRKKLQSLRKDCRVLNILIPSCIVLTTLIFGTYVQFAVLGNRTSFNIQCRFNVLNKQLISIATLMGVKLALYLAIWSILLCVTAKVNQILTHQSVEGRGVRLPYIKELHSILVGEERMDKRPGMEVRNRNGGSNRGTTNDEEGFKQLKTEDFLLELKNNSKLKDVFQLPYRNQNVSKQQLHKQKEEHHALAQAQESDRRMLVYRPLDNQKIESDKNLPSRKNDLINIIDEKFPKEFARNQSVEEYSVNNSLEKERDQNYQLLINSVERLNELDRLGTLPLSSKKKSFNQKDRNENIEKEKMRINFDQLRQYPPRNHMKQAKSITNGLRRQKNDISLPSQIRRVDSINQDVSVQTEKPPKVVKTTKTKVSKVSFRQMNAQEQQKQAQQSKQQFPESRSIIMRLDTLSEKSKKEIIN